MRYFYRDQQSQDIGPYTIDELRQLHLNGIVRPETVIVQEGDPAQIVFRDLWARLRAAGADPVSSASGASAPHSAFWENFTRRAGEDLRMLLPHLLVPLQELRSLSWLQNRALLSIAAIGLFPLIIIAVFADRGRFQDAYWSLAFYFSALWAMFFYYAFPTPGIRVPTCLLCFFGTGVVSISILLLAYRFPPLSWLIDLVDSRSLTARTTGFVLGVGVPEETCKALVLLFLLRHSMKLPPQLMMFYGLMCGLGFGIYEGVDYQMGRNVRFSRYAEQYYLLNVLRLTTLPFLHAIWTGIAGYFIAFAHLYPERKVGLFIVAIGLPALLHGLYDVFSSSVLGLFFALLSVLALYLYLAKSVEFEKMLASREPGA